MSARHLLAALSLALLAACAADAQPPAQAEAAGNAKPAPVAKQASKDSEQQALQKRWMGALKKLSDARRAVNDAQNDADKAEAQKQYDGARKELSEIAAERSRTVQRMAYQAQGLSWAAQVREQVRADDDRERFLLLPPSGPLIVELKMSLDGEPFRTQREAVVERLMESAQSERIAGSWEKALQHSGEFLMGRRIVNPNQLKAWVSRYDINLDGQVDRREIRALLAERFQGPAFALNGPQSRYNLTAGSVDLWPILDTDQDDLLSPQEIAAVSDRLKSRDQDGNDLLVATEVNGQPMAGRGGIVVRTNMRGRPAAPSLAVMLGPASLTDTVWQALTTAYFKDQSAPAIDPLPDAEWFRSLDANEDGKLQPDEAARIDDLPADLELTVRLGTSDGPLLVVDRLSDRVVKSGSSDRTLTLDLGSARLAVTVDGSARPSYAFDRQSSAYLKAYDKNGDGYLVKDELAARSYQFDQWDLDRDGKVYPKEIEQSLESNMALSQARIQALALLSNDALYEALDLSGDGRLGRAEMLSASKRLAGEFDRDGDGRITRSEVPPTIRLTIGRGTTAYRAVGYGRGTQPSAAVAKGPDWFVRMDRNGDGDLTVKEFLGTPERFGELDTNQDGFIEPAEAESAK